MRCATVDFRARAGGRLAHIPTTPRWWVIAFARMVGGLYVRWALGVRAVAVAGAHHLTGSPIVVFRHPSKDDPLLVYRVVSRAMAQAAVFPYGRDVPIWGGALVGWILPRVGAISVFHGVVNRESLAEIAAVVRSNAPIVLAPEAQVTYHNERVARCQRGAAVMAVDRLTAAADPNAVTVVPMGLRYHYPDRNGRVLRRFLRAAAQLVGCTVPQDSRNTDEAAGLRVLAVAETVVGWLHQHYIQTFPAVAQRVLVAESGPSSPGPADDRSTRAVRLNALAEQTCETALGIAEGYFGLIPQGDRIERVFAIRGRYWERLYPGVGGADRVDGVTAASGRTTGRSVAPGCAARALANTLAGEARMVARHMQVVDLLAYLDFTYLTERPTDTDRAAEYALSLVDLVQRALGHTIGKRPSWPGRRCTVTIGEPIAVAGLAAGRTRREAIAALHSRIEGELARLSGDDHRL